MTLGSAATSVAVSIHAPARGATMTPSELNERWVVSIHAPARGATTRVVVSPSASAFRSTLPRGERRERGVPDREASVSIHAPARGATRSRTRLHRISSFRIHAPARGATWTGSDGRRSPAFRSTLPRGERPESTSALAPVLSFRSTLPRGERPQPAPATNRTERFDPRSREGSDTSCPDPPPGTSVSIHAPARGATQSRPLVRGKKLFRSTLPRGERRRHI